MKRAFTLIELLVVIAIIAILAAILFPVFAQAKVAAKKTVDLSNQKQIGTGFTLYAGDNDDFLPLTSFPVPGDSWTTQVQPYVKSRELFRSPADASTFWPKNPTDPDRFLANRFRQSSYGLNAWMSGGFEGGRFATVTSIAAPANVIYVALFRDDVRPRDHFHPFYWGVPSARTQPFMQNMTFDAAKNETKELHLKAFTEGANFAYLDGHAKYDRWNRLFWQDPGAGVFAGAFDPNVTGGRP